MLHLAIQYIKWIPTIVSLHQQQAQAPALAQAILEEPPGPCRGGGSQRGCQQPPIEPACADGWQARAPSHIAVPACASNAVVPVAPGTAAQQADEAIAHCCGHTCEIPIYAGYRDAELSCCQGDAQHIETLLLSARLEVALSTPASTSLTGLI